MNFVKQAQRINEAHQLISNEKTGTPEEFARKLKISRSQLYNLIDTLKEFDAPVKYSKKAQSFYYALPFELELKYSLKIILEENAKEIFGGINLRPVLLDRSSIYLQ